MRLQPEPLSGPSLLPAHCEIEFSKCPCVDRLALQSLKLKRMFQELQKHQPRNQFETTNEWPPVGNFTNVGSSGPAKLESLTAHVPFQRYYGKKLQQTHLEPVLRLAFQIHYPGGPPHFLSLCPGKIPDHCRESGTNLCMYMCMYIYIYIYQAGSSFQGSRIPFRFSGQTKNGALDPEIQTQQSVLLGIYVYIYIFINLFIYVCLCACVSVPVSVSVSLCVCVRKIM